MQCMNTKRMQLQSRTQQTAEESVDARRRCACARKIFCQRLMIQHRSVTEGWPDVSAMFSHQNELN